MSSVRSAMSHHQPSMLGNEVCHVKKQCGGEQNAEPKEDAQEHMLLGGSPEAFGARGYNLLEREATLASVSTSDEDDCDRRITSVVRHLRSPSTAGSDSSEENSIDGQKIDGIAVSLYVYRRVQLVAAVCREIVPKHNKALPSRFNADAPSCTSTVHHDMKAEVNSPEIHASRHVLPDEGPPTFTMVRNAVEEVTVEVTARPHRSPPTSKAAPSVRVFPLLLGVSPCASSKTIACQVSPMTQAASLCTVMECPEMVCPEGLTDENVQTIMGHLSCTRQIAIEVYLEMNVSLVSEELNCSREWALELLKRHSYDPDLVWMHETDFDAQLNASVTNPNFELSELRTSWGTTVPVSSNDGAVSDVVFNFGGKRIRAIPEFLEFEWIETVPLAPDKTSDDSTTVDLSDSEE